MKQLYPNPKTAISSTLSMLYNRGHKIKQDKWQSIKSPDDTLEIMFITMKCFLPDDIKDFENEVKPNLPWAKDQFEERVGGIPLNPGKTYKYWPFFKNYDDSTHRKDELFSHTYMERFWPRYAGQEVIQPRRGIRFEYGDFGDIINLLKGDISTRQAYLPIFFPEDTGAHHGERIPCTLGYHFMVRNSELHIRYDIRSCDALRHFRDDIYMAGLLVYYLIQELSPKHNLKPGLLTMNISSLHTFYKERHILLKQIDRG